MSNLIIYTSHKHTSEYTSRENDIHHQTEVTEDQKLPSDSKWHNHSESLLFLYLAQLSAWRRSKQARAGYERMQQSDELDSRI